MADAIMSAKIEFTKLTSTIDEMKKNLVDKNETVVVVKSAESDKSEIKSEASIDESRFDFKCEQNGTTYYVEVSN